MYGKLFLVIVAVALIAQSAEAKSKKKKAVVVPTTVATTTVAPTTVTPVTLAPVAEPITTIWEDPDETNLSLMMSGIDRMLGGATKKFFDQHRYKYNNKMMHVANTKYLLDKWNSAETPEEAENRETLLTILNNMYPLSNYFYDLV